VNDVLAALRCAHSKAVFHLDLRIENIIVTLGDDGTFVRAILIDWGISYAGNSPKTYLTGLRGVCLAAATEICLSHEDFSEWVPSGLHDLESVTYLYEALLVGHYPWLRELRHTGSLKSMIESRYQTIKSRCRVDSALSVFCDKLFALRCGTAVDTMYDAWPV
jgi:serine/threonine protein kinase